MNICHVITRLIIGGAQENTILTCRGLAQQGHRVTLIAGPQTGPEGSLWDQTIDIGCDVVRLDTLVRQVQPFRDWRARRELVRLFERIRPDMVHTHSSKAGILGRSAARAAGVPLVVHTIHGMSFNRTQGWARQAVYRTLERHAARHTTAFVAVAEAMIAQAVAAGIAPRERFTLVRSGMRTEHYHPDASARARVRDQWGVRRDAVVVGTVARLSTHKGYEPIIEALPSALAADPRLRFVWVGNGANRSVYEQRLTALDIRDRVRFLGLHSPQETARVLTGFDVLLHASQWEGLPRAVVQALLTEVPVVSFDNDGAPEVVVDGETGALVPLNDVPGLASAIVAVAADAEARGRMGRLGRQRCLVLFDWQHMVDELSELYGRLARPPVPR